MGHLLTSSFGYEVRSSNPPAAETSATACAEPAEPSRPAACAATMGESTPVLSSIDTVGVAIAFVPVAAVACLVASSGGRLRTARSPWSREPLSRATPHWRRPCRQARAIPARPASGRLSPSATPRPASLQPGQIDVEPRGFDQACRQIDLQTLGFGRFPLGSRASRAEGGAAGRRLCRPVRRARFTAEGTRRSAPPAPPVPLWRTRR